MPEDKDGWLPVLKVHPPFGVAQGSVPGPLLYTLHTTPPCGDFWIHYSHHLYTVESQLYVLSPKQPPTRHFLGGVTSSLEVPGTKGSGVGEWVMKHPLHSFLDVIKLANGLNCTAHSYRAYQWQQPIVCTMSKLAWANKSTLCHMHTQDWQYP